MTPEDRVSCTMELQEDVAEKVEIIKKAISDEVYLFPQGDGVPKDAKDFKDELKRIDDYVTDLQTRTMKTCEAFSEDVKYWAEYKTGIKEFKPWLGNAENKSTEGLAKPQTLDEANLMFANVKDFESSCLKHLKILEDAASASNKMTTHKEADVEVAELKARYKINVRSPSKYKQNVFMYHFSNEFFTDMKKSKLWLMNGSKKLILLSKNGNF